VHVCASRGRRLRSTALALIAAAVGAAALACGASASGLPQGPPAGPTSPPFTQCPAIGENSTCEYLIDVTGGNPAVTVLRDPAARWYDGADDVTVAVQNDSEGLVESVHVGVPASGDGLFAFDGDGLCAEGIKPKPSECAFGPSLADPYDYQGPDTSFAIESADAGTVFFNTPLQPGQYTYFTLEAAPTQAVAAGEVNDVVDTTLTNAAAKEEGTALTTFSPVSITDRATIKGPYAAEAKGSVEYLVYSDPKCEQKVEALGAKKVEGGVAEASEPSNPANYALNATYYWVARYSGFGHNSPTRSACGGETMTFGAPPALPQPSITTVLSGEGQLGSHITVKEGTAVSDTAIITPPSGQQVTGRVTYVAYADSQCAGKGVTGLGLGGATTGYGPASNAVTLGAGKYYFQAFYSGSATLKSAATPCGEEVLTVLGRSAPPPKNSPPPPAPRGGFKFLRGLHVNESNGQIAITVQLPAAGMVTADAVLKQGASRASARRDGAHGAKKKRRCGRGLVRQHDRCTSSVPVLYGAASLTSSTAGLTTITIKPTKRALQALGRGKPLYVTVTVTFQASSGGSPITQTESVLVRISKPKHKRR
jgi:hypothetical protein